MRDYRKTFFTREESNFPAIKIKLSSLTLYSAITGLSNYSEQKDVADILTDLKKLENDPNIEDTFIDNLRSKLLAIYVDLENNVKLKFYSLLDATYEALIALAEIKPINDQDPITLEKIARGNVVLVTSGHQFDIYTLINWHNSRDYRGSELNETDLSQWILNPITNSPFSARDTKHIRDLAIKKGISIANLKSEATSTTAISDEFILEKIIVRDASINPGY